MRAPELAIPELETELLPALRVGAELIDGREEVSVGADLERDHRSAGHLRQRLLDPPVARFGHHELRWPLGSDGLCEFAGERSGVLRVVEGTVPYLASEGALRIPEVPHRTQKEGDARLGRPDMRRLLGDLRHPDRVLGRIEVIEDRGGGIELIPEHEDEMAERSAHIPI